MIVKEIRRRLLCNVCLSATASNPDAGTPAQLRSWALSRGWTRALGQDICARCSTCVVDDMTSQFRDATTPPANAVVAGAPRPTEEGRVERQEDGLAPVCPSSANVPAIGGRGEGRTDHL